MKNLHRNILLVVLLVLVLFQSDFIFGQSIKTVDSFKYALNLYNNEIYLPAIELFEEFISNNPSNPQCPDAQYYIAEAHFSRKDYANALLAYKKYTSVYPGGMHIGNVWFRRAECEEALGNDELALETFIAISKNLFDTKEYAAPALYRAANYYKRNGDFENALTYLYKLVENYPNHELQNAVQIEIANIHADLGDFSKSIRELEKIEYSRAPDPEKMRAAYFKGKYSILIRDFSQGEEALRKVIANSPADSAVHHEAVFSLAEHYFYLMRTEEAEALLTTLIQNNQLPADVTAFARMLMGINKYNTKQYDEARTFLEPALDDMQNESKAFRKCLYYAAMTNKAIGDETRAVSYFSQMFSPEWFASVQETPFEPYIPDAFKNFIKTSKQINSPFDISLYTSEIRRISDFFPAPAGYLQWAKLFMDAGDFATAEFLLNKGISRFPENRSGDYLYYELGNLFELQGKYPDAAAQYEKTIDMFPGGNAAVEAELKAAYIRLKQTLINPEEIQRQNAELTNLALNEMRSGGSTGVSSETELKFGKFHFEITRDYDKAIEHFDKIKESGPSETYFHDALQYSAMIYDNLVRIYIYENDIEAIVEARDNAISTYRLYLERYTGTPFSVTARRRIIDLTLDAIDDADERRKSAEQMYLTLASASEPELAAYGIIRIVEISIQSGVSTDSLVVLSDRLKNLPAGSLDEILREIFYYTRFLISKQISDVAGVVEACTIYINEFPKGPKSPEIRYYGAKTLIESSAQITASLWLKQLNEEFYYSSYVDSARVLYAGLLVEEGRVDEALMLYQQEISEASGKNNRNLITPLIRLTAEAYKRKNNLVRAVDHYRLFIILSEENNIKQAEGYFEMGQIFELQYKMADAVMAYVKVIELYPDSEIAIKSKANQAYIYSLQEDFRSAGDLYRELSLSELPDTSKVYYEYFYISNLYKQDLSAQAKTALNEFERKYRDLPKILIDDYKSMLQVEEADVHRRALRFKDAEELLRDVIDDNPGSEAQQYAEYLLGITLIQQAKIEEGFPLLREFDKKYPNSRLLHQVYYRLGTIMKNDYENFKEAYIWFAKAVETPDGKHNIQTHRNYIEICGLSGFAEAQISAIRTFLENFPNAQDLMEREIDIGLIYMEQKRFDEAIAQFKSILPQASLQDELRIQTYIGQCYFEKENYLLAITEFLKIPLFGTTDTDLPWHTTALHYTARCFEQIGNYKKAIEYLDEVIKKEGENSLFGKEAIKDKSRVQNLIKIRK